MNHGIEEDKQGPLLDFEELTRGNCASFGSQQNMKQMSSFQLQPPETTPTNANNSQIRGGIFSYLNRINRQQYFESLVILAIGLSFIAIIISASHHHHSTTSNNESSDLAGAVLKNQKVSPSKGAGWFKNPVLAAPGGDPFITYRTDQFYYMTFVTNHQEIAVYKSNFLSNWNSAVKTIVYHVPGSFVNAWGPKIQFIQGNWYIYFSMGIRSNSSHRYMYVIVASDPKNPLGHYGQAIRISAFQRSEDRAATQGTVIEYSNGRLYIIYSGIPDQSPGKLYIAPMSDPTKISGPRVLLRESSNSVWDTNGLYMPHEITKGNRTNIVFTAFSSPLTSCLGLMGIDNGEDPLVSSNWWHNNDGCVFWGNEQQDVFDTQYGAFTKSRDLTEDWMIYCAASGGLGDHSTRTLRLTKVTWNVDGTPLFPRPNGLFTALALPSGEVI